MPESARSMRIWTVFQRPPDYPTANFVVRGFTVTAEGPVPDEAIAGTATTIEGARRLVPREADVRFPRADVDPPTVVETWL